MAEIVRPAIVEFIGTFALIFMGAGAIIVTGDHYPVLVWPSFHKNPVRAGV
jgi:hypothetical protein